MSATAREGILEAIATLLGTVPNATFYRSREAAAQRQEGTVITLHPVEEPVQLRGGPQGLAANQSIAMRDLNVKITVLARGDIPDQVADPIVQALHQTLMSDTTLGGRVARILEVVTKWDFTLADLDACACEIIYQLRYQTAAANLSQSI